MNKFQVVGKVIGGQVRMMAVSEGRVIGSIKPVSNMTTVEIPAFEVVLKTESIEIDSPFISMANENRKKVVAERESRMSKLYRAN